MGYSFVFVMSCSRKAVNTKYSPTVRQERTAMMMMMVMITIIKTMIDGWMNGEIDTRQMEATVVWKSDM
jgi:hypothetical protein